MGQTMINCNQCGAENDADSNFCQDCGEVLQARSPNAMQPVPASASGPILREPDSKVTVANELVPSLLHNSQQHQENNSAVRSHERSKPGEAAIRESETETLREAWKTVPESELDLVGKGWKRFDEGDFAGALNLATQATQLDSQNHHAWALLGWANHRWGENEQAIACTKRAIQLRPNDPAGYADLGAIYENLKQWSDALREFRRASQIEPERVLHRAKVGWTLYAMGDLDEAISVLEQCADEAPDNEQVKFYLACAYLTAADRGWVEVASDNEFGCPAGRYPTSRAQISEAQTWISKAERLNCGQGDAFQESIRELKPYRELKAVIARALKREFHGSIITPIFGGLMWTFFYGLGLILAPLYFYVSRPPGYLINKENFSKNETADDAAKHESGFGRIGAYALWGVFLPVLVVRNYLRNFTGEQKELTTNGEIPHAGAARVVDSIGKNVQPVSTEGLSQGQSVTTSAMQVTATAATTAGVLQDNQVVPSASAAMPAPASAAEAKLVNTASSNKMPLLIGGGVAAVALLIGGGLYYNKSHKEDQLRAELEQKTQQLRASEEKARAAEENRRREAEKTRIARNDATRAPAQAQPQVAVQESTGVAGDRVDAPAARVGDTYTYETIDHIDPKLNNVTSREIVSVSPQEVTVKFVNAKTGYTRFLTYDTNLGLLGSRFGNNEGSDYRPALKYFSFPIRPGDTWNSSSTETNLKTGKTRIHTLRGRIEGLETVTVPAGTFRAFKITIDSEMREDSKVIAGRDVSWYTPDVKRTVKSELESKESETGKTGRRTVSLTSYSLR